MCWYDGLLTNEFIEYFGAEDSVYYTVSARGKTYHETYVKFRETVEHIFNFFIFDTFEESCFFEMREKDPYLYKLAETFYKDEKRPDFQKVYHSIDGNMFCCKLETLTADQIAVGLMFTFASRMAGSIEDEFAEAGRMRQFVLALNEKRNAQKRKS